MNYLNVTLTTTSYDLALSRCKLLQLDQDSYLGEVFGEYILSSIGNNPVIVVGKSCDNYFKKGMYVNLFPLKYIYQMESNLEYLDMPGFSRRTINTAFYPLKGFDKHLNEIADFDATKATIKSRYIYEK